MKKTLTLIVFAFFNLCLFAQAKTVTQAAKTSGRHSDFPTHSFEFQVTPSADYAIYHYGSNVALHPDKPYDHHLPMAGFNFGAQYLYRPVEVFSVSTGLTLRLQGMMLRESSGGHVVSRDIMETMFLTLPIYFHLHKKMQSCTFEFATGPEFTFPTLYTSKAMTYDGNGNTLTTDMTKTKVSTDQMHDYAALGWSIFLGGERRLCDHGDLFIGPQINFRNILQFNKDMETERKTNGGWYDVSLGIKLGFRFH